MEKGMIICLVHIFWAEKVLKLNFVGTQNIPYHIDFSCDAKQQEHCQKIQKRILTQHKKNNIPTYFHSYFSDVAI